MVDGDEFVRWRAEADDAEAAIADAELVMRSIDDTWSQLAQEAGR